MERLRDRMAVDLRFPVGDLAHRLCRAYMLNVTPRSSHLNEPLGNTRTQTRQSTKL